MTTPNTTTSATRDAEHTPGPWKVMPCPINAGKHPFHDSRWITTADAEVEFSRSDTNDWRLTRGSLICGMRDVPPANARLIAAAPRMYDAIREVLDMEQPELPERIVRLLSDALNAAEGGAES